LTSTHDIVVIGGGSAGLTGARFAARLGARVALIEKDRIGGDCTWTGCVPSKALLRAAKVAHGVREAGKFGIDVPAPVVDMVRVRAHVMGAVRAVYEGERPEVLREEGIDVVLAPARFIGPKTIEAGDRTLTARRFVICTGARPFVPPIPGLKNTAYWTHETIFDNERLPRHLIVLGAGPIGAELAQAYRRLGAEVSMLATEFLPEADPELRDFVRGLLEKEGVRISLGPVASVEMNGGEFVLHGPGTTIDSDDPDGPRGPMGPLGVTRGDALLVVTGRRPTVDGLGLDVAGVDHSALGITVDRYLQTSVRHIYAAGDVLGGAQFTHLAGWQCFQAVRNALLPGHSPGIPKALPTVTFVDPEIASVGLSEAEARARHGLDMLVHRWEMGDSDRALADGEPEGFIKVVARADGRVLGASIAAARAGEMIAEFALALDQGFGLSELANAVHAYPTWTSAVQQVASAEATDRFLSSRLGRLALRISGLGVHAPGAEE
jgi:pyruvate/2-oxoglutarate dehydrogenase complex dihydrolipoamide dehydrogenase (E3) component